MNYIYNRKSLTFIVSIVCLFLLTFVLKGSRKNNDTLNFQLGYDKTIGGPFESSGSTSRYALTEAFVKFNTLFFNTQQSQFAAPDVSEYKGKYFSIFTPGVSFLAVPFYLVGNVFQLPQLFTYSLNIILAFMIFLLMIKLSQITGSGLKPSIIAAITFIFATNLLPYTGSFTQHLASTAVIILAIINVSIKRTLINNIWLGILFGAGILLDLPNVFMMAPIILYVIYKHFVVNTNEQKINLSINLNIFGIFIGLIPLILIFGLYNFQTSGSYFKAAQFIGRSKIYAPQDYTNTNSNTNEKKFSIRLPFKTRNQIRGIYILTLSDERGVFYYSPVLILGLIGLYILYQEKKDRTLIILLLCVALFDLFGYSMFSDYHGGWAFGSRYMIPAEAMMSVGLGFFIQKYRHKILVPIIFLVLFSYSVFVNTLGAMTTTLIPPKQEAVTYPYPVTYTYLYNYNLVKGGEINSLIYNTYLANNINGMNFVLIYTGVVISVVSILYYFSLSEKQKNP